MGEGVAIALITGGFSVIVAMLHLARKENRVDHGVVATKLDNLADGHARIESKIDNHVGDHARGQV